MSAYDDEALKSLGPRLEPPRAWWVKWAMLALFATCAAVAPVLARLLR
jgi:hypothetical protein